MKKLSALLLIPLFMIGFQNCANSSGVDPLYGTEDFVSYGEPEPVCKQGTICKEENELNCYMPETWYQHSPTHVCLIQTEE